MAGGPAAPVTWNVEDLYELVDKYPQYLTGVTPYVSACCQGALPDG